MRNSKKIVRFFDRYGKNGCSTKASVRVVNPWYVRGLEVAALVLITVLAINALWSVFVLKGTEEYREEISALQGQIEAERVQHLAALDEAAEITDKIIESTDLIVEMYEAKLAQQSSEILFLKRRIDFYNEKTEYYKKGKAEQEKTADAYLQALRSSKTKAEALLLDNTQLRIRLGNPNIEVKEAKQQAESFIKWSRFYQYPLHSALRVGWVESRFKSDAVSEAGARGVMQVMPFWADEFDYVTSKELLTDADKNIRAGINILSDYSDKAGGRLSLVAYNQGITRVFTDSVIGTAAVDYLESYYEARKALGE